MTCRTTRHHATDYAPTGRIFHWGAWQIPSKAAALCPDGHWRMVEITGDADTYFSIPARARIDGKWRIGYVMWDRDVTTGDTTYPYVLTFRCDR